MDIVLATRNKKKIQEIDRILAGTGIRLHSLEGFPLCPEVEEDADTFEGNALKKAFAVSAFTNMPAVSDDSGLEVPVLGGAPGVFSARYAGPKATDDENVMKLLSEMADTPDEKRDARFVCVIALAYPDGRSVNFMGSAEGTIGRNVLGRNGFGYDPVFYPAGQNRTFAEMSAEEKDKLSHRNKALEKLQVYLKSLNNQSHK